MEQEVAKGDHDRPAEMWRKAARPRRAKLGSVAFQGKLNSPEERRAAGKALRDKVPRENQTIADSFTSRS